MPQIHRPRFELLWPLTNFISVMSQSLAKRMGRVLRHLNSGKGRANDRVQLGRIRKAHAGKAQIGEPPPLHHAHPRLGEQRILWPKQFHRAETSEHSEHESFELGSNPASRRCKAN